MRAELVQRLMVEMEAARVRRSRPAGFPELPPIPKARYTGRAFFELERDGLWKHSWLYAGHSSELPEPGCFLASETTGAPVVVVRTDSGGVRAFYNVCQHRGAALVRERSGRLHAFQCPYHAWVYDLDGRLKGRPEEHEFPSESVALVPVRCEVWGGWIFVNRDPDARPLLETLGDLPDELAEFRVDELRHAGTRSSEIACNWKLVVEAFLETYHLDHLHPNTAGMLLDSRATAIALLPEGHSRMLTRKRAGVEHVGFHVPGMPEIPDIGELPRTTILSYHFFPNVITPLDIAAFPFVIIWPLDERNSRIDVHFFGVDWGAGERPESWESVFALFDLVMAEDTANLASIQTSVESEGFTRPRLGHHERRIQAFHEHLDRVIGSERIPEKLRVAQRLADRVEGWVSSSD